MEKAGEGLECHTEAKLAGAPGAVFQKLNSGKAEKSPEWPADNCRNPEGAD